MIHHLALFGALLCGGGPGAPHPNSMSFLDLDFADGGVAIEWQIQVRTLAEVPGLWPVANADHATDEEVLAAWPKVKPYLEDGLWFEVDDLRFQADFSRWEVNSDRDQISFFAQRPNTPIGKRFVVGFSQFVDDGNPGHRLYIEVTGRLPEPQLFALSTDLRAVDFGAPPTRAERLWESLRYGWEHVLAGHDHLAFLLALLFGVASGAALLAAVTAFTLAHSLTLGIAAAGWFLPSPTWVEPGITLSILVTLWWHVTRGPGHSRAWVPAFLFGLLHGFGFAGVFAGFQHGELLLPLLGFNLGVEVGQLTFLSGVLLAWWLVGRLAAARLHTVRDLAAIVLGAYTFWLCGKTAADRWHWRLDSLPEPWTAWPGTLAAALLVWLILRTRRTPKGTPVATMAAQALLLTLFWSTGRWLGGA